MSEFKLELIVKKIYIGSPKKWVMDEANRFKENYFFNHRGRLSKSKGENIFRLMDLFKDLEDTRFWGVLSRIDGSSNYMNPEPIEKREEKRKWARENFEHHELNNLLNIVFNQALLMPLETAWPGTKRGHSILYEELVDKKDSMFYGVVDERLHKLLNNGRFWEELIDLSPGTNSGMSYLIVEDVLLNNFDELDVDFAPKGFEIFYRRSGDQERSFNIRHMSNKSIHNYYLFINKLNENKRRLRIKDEDMEHLVKPYIEAVIDTDEDGIPKFKDFKNRLINPCILPYILKFEGVKEEIAEQLRLNVEYDSSNIEHVVDVLDILPNRDEIFNKMLREADNPSKALTYVIKGCEKHGYSFKHILTRDERLEYNPIS